MTAPATDKAKDSILGNAKGTILDRFKGKGCILDGAKGTILDKAKGNILTPRAKQ
ncbi:MAG: hypothetical protein KME02_03760 [Aphanothece saxicola GSE-SYN-MK-01-06B]|jgi:hypothetical protein|nr:hypothetical protein [Aphanothece saxicola GSE-SYN-MK-01-06B]